jgi:hypothetical protein
MALRTNLGYRRAVPLIIVILVVAMSGAAAHSQHSQSGSQPASDSQAWSDLQRSMLAMHGAMASIQSTEGETNAWARSADTQARARNYCRPGIAGADTCVEAAVRYAAELGYEVTVVRDATADYSEVEMHAALDVILPNYANAIASTEEIVEAISSLSLETKPASQVA